MRYLTLEQAADRVGKTPRTVQRWVRDGVLEVLATVRKGSSAVRYFDETAVLEADRSMKPGRPAGEGATLYRLPTHWRRDVSGEVERAELPDPVGAVYQVSGELLEVLLRDAGWSPSIDVAPARAGVGS